MVAVIDSDEQKKIQDLLNQNPEIKSIVEKIGNSMSSHIVGSEIKHVEGLGGQNCAPNASLDISKQTSIAEEQGETFSIKNNNNNRGRG